ncbi:MAG TPA: flagellar motor protein [Bryobacteraceae bacterium]|nr:flagellar motor protein [Bryobacteraceae bacterium]
MATESRATGTRRPDYAALCGIVVALGGILGGLVLEGGKIADVAQLTAAMIVLGGTIGAVMLTTPFAIIKTAVARLKTALYDEDVSPAGIIEQIVSFATKARKTGIISLERDAAQIPDPFLKKALMLAVDGTELQAVREMMQLQMRLESSEADTDARVFEAAGGYAPTIGIIGAVIGLIQVMKHLDNINRVGYGIAVAFVATIYGVGVANLFLLPMAQKIRTRVQQRLRIEELMLEGVSSISEGMNPRLIRRKLDAFVREQRHQSPRIVEPSQAPPREASA